MIQFRFKYPILTFNTPYPIVGIGPVVMTAIVPPLPSPASADKKGSAITIGQEEVFLSRNSYENDSGYGIHFVGLKKIMGTEYGVRLF